VFTERRAVPFPLSLASDGARVRVHALGGGRGLALRLTELGLNVGSEVRVLQHQGGGLLLGRGEARIAIGGGLATKVLVVPV